MAKQPEFKYRDSLLTRFYTKHQQDVISEAFYEMSKKGEVNPQMADVITSALENYLQNKRATDTMFAQQLQQSTDEIVARVTAVVKLQLQDLMYSILQQDIPENQKLNLLLNIVQNQFKLPDSIIRTPDASFIAPLDFEYKVKTEINNKKRQK